MVETLVQLVHKLTPLRLFCRSVEVLFCMLAMTISIREIPITKITGLNIIAMRLESLNISNILPQLLGLNISIKIRNGAQMMNTRRSPILIIFAMTSKRSPIVKKNNKTNLSANFTTVVVVSAPDAFMLSYP